MWRKTESPEPLSASPQPPNRTTREPAKNAERATIGPSIAIQGDVTGEEDLVIQGRVEGKIDLKQHSVTIGKNGRVKADVYGRTITIEGEVNGNLFGEEQIIVRQPGRVEGNLTAPRVTLEDGAKFRGNIDMESPKDSQRSPSKPSGPSSSASASVRPEPKPEPKTGAPEASKDA